MARWVVPFLTVLVDMHPDIDTRFHNEEKYEDGHREVHREDHGEDEDNSAEDDGGMHGDDAVVGKEEGLLEILTGIAGISPVIKERIAVVCGKPPTCHEDGRVGEADRGNEAER